jgi:hypothetical protein
MLSAFIYSRFGLLSQQPGSLAMFAAMRRASFLAIATLPAECRPGGLRGSGNM